MKTLIGFAAGLLLASVSFAAQLTITNTAAQTMIQNFLKAEALRLDGKFLDGITNREQWEARRGELRQQYLEMLGLWPMPERTPLEKRSKPCRGGTTAGTPDRRRVSPFQGLGVSDHFPRALPWAIELRPVGTGKATVRDLGNDKAFTTLQRSPCWGVQIIPTFAPSPVEAA